MEHSWRRLSPAAWWVAPGLLAAAIALELSRPFRAGPVAYDGAMSVLHFERIAAGRHLEQFVATTPKPLLTVVFGPLYALGHDWRALTWATILAFAVGVSLATALARRLGGRNAGLFAAVALAGSPALLFDASIALATPWAMLLWAVAGLAATAHRPRYAVAGLALGAASLARLETLVAVGVALAAMAAASAARGRLGRGVPPGAWWVALGLGAVPLMMLHDTLLTGDPLFWLGVSTKYTAATVQHVDVPGELAAQLTGHYLAQAGLVLLAAIGWLRLAGRGRGPVAIGLLGLGPGILAFLVLMSARHIFVPLRYLASPDVAVAFAAALGVGAVSVELPAALRSWAAARPRVRAWGAPAAVAAVAVALAGGWAGMGIDLRPTARAFTRAAVSERLAVPALRAAIPAAAQARRGAPDSVLVLVPTQLRPAVVVDLGLSLDEVAAFDPASIDVVGGRPAAGQLLLRSASAGGTSAGLEQLSVSAPTRIGAVTVVPLLADPRSGTWVVRVDGGSAAVAAAGGGWPARRAAGRS